MKKILNIILVCVLIYFAFSMGGIIIGAAAVVAAAAFYIYKSLPSLYVTMARANYQKNNEKMFALFEKAYKTGRMSPDDKTNYGYMCMREGRLERAEQMFNAVLAYKHDAGILARARTSYALLLWKKGELDEALELMEEVFEVYKSTVVYGNYGYLLLLKGDLHKALQINLEAFDYDDTNDIIADNLAQNYYLLGDYEKSMELYKDIMERSPQFPIPYYNCAKTLYAMGMKEEAAEKLRTALGFPFSSVAAIEKETVAGFLNKIEAEL